METGDWTITVQGPNGVKHVVVPGEQVKFFGGLQPDPYAIALWLAYCDLWAKADPTEQECPSHPGKFGDH